MSEVPAETAAPPPELQRITIAFNEAEDRISLTGATGAGQVQIIWLTRRMLDRLVPHLCEWLEAREPMGAGGKLPRADLAQTMAQQRAVSALTQKEERPVVSEPGASSWLATAVDIKAGSSAVGLLLRTAQAEQRAQLTLAVLAMRQWLAILLQQYQRAAWPLDAWPSWMVDALAEQTPAQRTLLH